MIYRKALTAVAAALLLATGAAWAQSSIGLIPGISSAAVTGALLSANNLSDLSSTSAALANLGIGTAGTANLPAIGAPGAFSSLVDPVWHALPTTSATLTCTGTVGNYPYNDIYSGSLAGTNVTYTLPASGCADFSVITEVIKQDGGHTVTNQTSASGGKTGTEVWSIGSTAGNIIVLQYVWFSPLSTWLVFNPGAFPTQPLPVNTGGTGSFTPNIANRQVGTGTSYTVPAGCSMLIIDICGAGGGGGGVTTGGSAACAAASGSAGSCARLKLANPAGVAITYALGAAGAAGTNGTTPTAGSAGGATTLSLGGTLVVTLNGGPGGGASTVSSTTCTAAGAPGTAGGMTGNFADAGFDISAITTNGGSAGQAGSASTTVSHGGSIGNRGGDGGVVSSTGSVIATPTAGDAGFIGFECIGATQF
jgi:hypothetical protein